VAPPSWTDHAKMRLKQRWRIKPAPWLMQRLSRQMSERRQAWLLWCEPRTSIEHWGVRYYHKEQGGLWIPMVVNVANETVITVQPVDAWRNLNYPRLHIEQPFRGELEGWLACRFAW